MSLPLAEPSVTYDAPPAQAAALALARLARGELF